VSGMTANGLGIISFVVQIAGAVAAAFAAAWIASRRDRYGRAGIAIVISLLLTTFWCSTVALSPSANVRQGLFEALANLGWLLVIYRLFAGDGRHTTLTPIRPVMLVLAGVSLAQICLALTVPQLSAGRIDGGAGSIQLFLLATVLSLLQAVGGLLLLHNLYVSADSHARLALRWPALALAALWAFDLNLYAIAYIGRVWPAELASLRGMVVIGVAMLMTLGGASASENLRFRPSRTVTFQSVSLFVIGGYLTAMVAGAQWLAYAGGDFAQLVQFVFVIGAVVLAVLLLPSRRLRGWIKVMVVKHFFQHRYDYRVEWMRFTRTMTKGDDLNLPLEQRAVQAIADIADSPGGLLLTTGDNDELGLVARWQWPSAEVPSAALSAEASAFFEQTGLIVDLDDLRAGKELRGEGGFVPQWLRDDPRAWALVPLLHERLAGVVILARPTPVRKFDWEDFDLLRVAGQQIASYLAEHSMQAALAESSRFDDFHRRIAFVMHDIKNLASQLSLLARNAELHAENPEFRADMLVTLRNSAEKLNTLLARLSRYVSGGSDRIAKVDVAEIVKQVTAQFLVRHPVSVAECQPCEVMANSESLEQVLVHLVQNAVDASAPDAPVILSLSSDGLHAKIEVIDAGCGMSLDFVRTKLFKPFVSSKQGGFGIGAFEARELVKAMQGRLDVESREGLGSRFIIKLPLAETSSLYKSFSATDIRQVA
jgi:putative PEP-CTERM system histidine kinase